MALGDARRARNQTMQDERRESGEAMRKARQDLGDAMEKERRGSLVNDVNALLRPDRASKTLPEVQSRGGVPASTSSGSYRVPETAKTGGGIASPLTEKTKSVDGKTVPDREYYAGGLTSSDGLFILPAIKTMNMTDANGAAVQFQYADPNGTVATEVPT